jgi:hypothetical protein
LPTLEEIRWLFLFLICSNRVPLCPQVRSNGWCGDLNCKNGHIFVTCHQFQNHRPCGEMCKTSTHQMRMHISRVEEMAHLQTGKMTWTIFSEAIRCKQVRNICQYYTKNKKCVHQNCKFLHVDDTGDFFITCHICLLGTPIRNGDLVALSCGHYLCRNCWGMHVWSCYNQPNCPTCRKECVDVCFLKPVSFAGVLYFLKFN